MSSDDYYLKHTMSLVNVDTILVEITASIFRIQLNISNTAHCYMEQKTKKLDLNVIDQNRININNGCSRKLTIVHGSHLPAI
jgi:hypothetical protein